MALCPLSTTLLALMQALSLLLTLQVGMSPLTQEQLTQILQTAA
jgi:hypothetical protein